MHLLNPVVDPLSIFWILILLNSFGQRILNISSKVRAAQWTLRSYFKYVFAALDMEKVFLVASKYHDLVEVIKILETDNTFRTNIVLSIF
jgi:hypothetical protein